MRTSILSSGKSRPDWTRRYRPLQQTGMHCGSDSAASAVLRLQFSLFTVLRLRLRLLSRLVETSRLSQRLHSSLHSAGLRRSRKKWRAGAAAH